MNNLELMIDYAQAFERRYRDTKRRDCCLSIEHRYQGEELTQPTEHTVYGYGEDAFWLGLTAWGKVPQAMQKMIKVSFGMGAKSQADYEERLQQAFAVHGEKTVHTQTDAGLIRWLEEIRRLAGEDFELLFERL
nr:MAG TPA: hypothetical protein [Caudoviricetes sp.]